MDGISIIIPTYQEANSITTLIHTISSLNLPENKFEVIVVDDNSSDGTIDNVEQLMATYHWLKLVKRNCKRSLSDSVIQGLGHARFEFLVVMDADSSHPPQLISNLVTALEKSNTDFVIGSRYISGGGTDSGWPIMRKIISRVAALFATLTIGTKIHDPLSGFFALRKSTFLKADKLDPIGWKIGLELIVKCHCKNVVEVPIYFNDRIQDRSKLSAKIMFLYLLHLTRLAKYKWHLRHITEGASS